MFMVDAGFFLNLMWKALSPMVTAETKAKVQFVSGSLEKKAETFLKYFDADQLESDFGGEVEHAYQHESYWDCCCEDHQSLLDAFDASGNESAAAASSTKKKKKRRGGKGKNK